MRVAERAVMYMRECTERWTSTHCVDGAPREIRMFRINVVRRLRIPLESELLELPLIILSVKVATFFAFRIIILVLISVSLNNMLKFFLIFSFTYYLLIPYYER